MECWSIGVLCKRTIHFDKAFSFQFLSITHSFILSFFHYPALQYSILSVFHYSTTPSLNFSFFHSSITPALNTPFFQYSTTPFLHSLYSQHLATKRNHGRATMILTMLVTTAEVAAISHSPKHSFTCIPRRHPERATRTPNTAL